MEYIVVYESTPYDLETTVEEKIKRGFTPLGGIAVTSINNRMKYYQAMVRNNDDPEI